jgi:hypothetical protein
LVRERGGYAGIGATLALPRLHSHFMAEWKPGRAVAVSQPVRGSIRKQNLHDYCALQHENARFRAKFFVTFSFALG